MSKKEYITINIKRFVLVHKRRIFLLRRLEKEKRYGRLIFQIAFLGFESLSRLLYSKEKFSSRRFIRLLSKTIDKKESKQLYKYWRNPLIHEGFVPLFTALESWDEEDLGFISFPEEPFIKMSIEYPPESIIAIYKHLIDYLEDYFRKRGIKEKKLVNSLS